jgi:hypothetical protein
MSGINWLAVVVGVVVSYVVGFLWYGPLFGNTWLRIIGKKREDIEASPSMYAVTAVASLVTMVVLAMVIAAFGAETFVDGLVAGAVVFIGLGATATFVFTTFSGPPLGAWFLLAAYQLLVHGVMGGVFATWK